MRNVFFLLGLLLSLNANAQTIENTDYYQRKQKSLPVNDEWQGIRALPAENPGNETSRASQAPVANAGNSQSLTLPLSSATLDGSASYDPDGSIVQYYWYQAKGPVAAVIGNAFAAKPTVTGFTTAGPYIFVLQVKDNNGDIGYAQMTLTVNAAGTITPPPCVINTSPANGSAVTSPTSATLSWPIVPQATSYDVYLWKGTTAPTAPVTNTTSNGYTAGSLSANTQYYWYIVPRNAGGAAQGCSGNTTSFKTWPGATCTSNISPINGATINTASKATLSWNEVPGATSYNVFIWPASDAEIGPRVNVTGTSCEVMSLGGSTTYRWYVAPMFGNTSGGGCNSSATIFTTAAAGPYPNCFVNTVSPANASTLPSQTSVRLTWLAPAAAASYEIYLAAGNDKPATLLAKTTALTYYVTNLKPGVLYSWYVWPKNAEGVDVTCNDVNVNSFTTAIATGGGNRVPVASAGISQSISLPNTSVTLDGSASYDQDGSIAEYYWYQASGPVTSTISNAFSTFPAVTGLTTAGKYVFGLQVKDNNGVTAYASVTVTVLPAGTITIPSCISNASPANGSSITTQTTATLSWPAASLATSYDVFLWTGSTAPASPTAIVATTSYSATNLVASTIYNWYVVPKNANGSATGCASNATAFTTAIPPPPCSGLLAPVGMDTVSTPTSAVLTWAASPTATSYDLHLSTSYTALPVAYATGITSTSYTATGLYPISEYSWYVVPKNAGGYAVNCPTAIGFFYTALPATTNCVANISPANGASLGSTTATLTWNENRNDVTYKIYIWTGSTMPLVETGSTFASNTYTVTGLLPSTLYHWYVLPWNKSGNPSADCSVTASSFITGIALPECIANISPANASLLPSQTSARLVWPASPGAASYDVYLTAGNGIPAVRVTNTTALSYYASNLTAGTLYSWYVAPVNANGGNTACSATNKTTFTTAIATGGSNLPPVANAGSNQTISLPASSVTLDGTASYDPNGSIVQYYWFQAKGPVSSSISNVYAAMPTVTGLNAAGSYTYVLQVKDNNGQTAYAQVMITVNTTGTLRQVADARTVTTTAATTATAATIALAGMARPGLTASISPNPAAPGKTARLQLTSDKMGTAIVHILNSNGALVATQRVALVAGITTTNISTTLFSQGLYIITVTGGPHTASLKLLVE